MAGNLGAQVARDREICQPVTILVDPQERDRVCAVRRLAPLQLRVVRAEQQDVGRAAVLVVERLPCTVGEPLVRRRHAVAELEVARQPPDDQENEEDPERDWDPAEPAAIRPEAEAASPAAPRLRTLRGLGNLPPGTAAAVDAVRLISGRHAAGYGSHEG